MPIRPWISGDGKRVQTGAHRRPCGGRIVVDVVWQAEPKMGRTLRLHGRGCCERCGKARAVSRRAKFRGGGR